MRYIPLACSASCRNGLIGTGQYETDNEGTHD